MQTIATIEEIRKTRYDISRKCGFDPHKLVDLYIKRQKKKYQSDQPLKN